VKRCVKFATKIYNFKLKDVLLSAQSRGGLFYPRKGKSLLAKSGGSKGNKALDQLTESEEDDGDYATLREIPSDTVSEENKVLTYIIIPYRYFLFY
jgi:hypothetical protein